MIAVIRLCVQNHTNNAEVGQIFQATKPRLAIATHLSVNPHTYVPIITAIRSTYPTGKSCCHTCAQCHSQLPNMQSQMNCVRPCVSRVGMKAQVQLSRLAI